MSWIRGASVAAIAACAGCGRVGYDDESLRSAPVIEDVASEESAPEPAESNGFETEVAHQALAFIWLAGPEAEDEAEPEPAPEPVPELEPESEPEAAPEPALAATMIERDGDPTPECAAVPATPVASSRDGTATLIGDAAEVPGLAGGAIALSGDGLVRMEDAPSPTGSFTLELWVSTTGEGVLASKVGAWETESGFEVAVEDSTLHLHVHEDGSCQWLDGFAAIDDGVPHHVAFVRDVERCTIAIVVDGVLDIEAPLEIRGPLEAPVFLSIGGLESDTSVVDRGITGFVDAISLYESALAVSEIAAIHAAGSAGICRDG